MPGALSDVKAMSDCPDRRVELSRFGQAANRIATSASFAEVTARQRGTPCQPSLSRLGKRTKQILFLAAAGAVRRWEHDGMMTSAAEAAGLLRLHRRAEARLYRESSPKSCGTSAPVPVSISLEVLIGAHSSTAEDGGSQHAPCISDHGDHGQRIVLVG